ncbi:bifunctional aspartate kinase/diaminopimelate decarboxylase [Aliifodinibius sp. S!AR15-10]|uniref:bifunctional aspartate kinase/diaminopimelate decarboxylase n=1 Tax=Aliifodinibius sp. S!AR15-10 TaxID=2950437 RepID=UPI002857E137|nr:bifunctional aspartate kinase/diaminopimelate decarboxylase [Aliifodinibius sp. S!AR15-10]MDR8392732.1 bifunctional aspartate kinase/diaminopimelate decarboxylase [Aliifodinibius sp. S!AR15-10]
MTNNSHNWIVLKFGGTSVSSLSNWQNITSILQDKLSEGYRVCLVHSALSGISNKLEEIIDLSSTDESETVLEEIKQQHRDLANDLGLDADELLSGEFEELEQLSRGVALLEEAGYHVQARIMALGELMSTKLGVAYVKSQGLDAEWKDARMLLKSIPVENASEKSLVLSAICDTSEDKELQQQLDEEGHDLILTQGFIASDNSNKTVVLGRGGSDVSASYFAAKLNAERLEIWTDVPGMFSCNPHAIPSARLLKHLSYAEAQEIATNGAKVLHPRCIMPARVHNIPIQIKWTQDPEQEGTTISSAVADDEALVKAISVRDNVILVSMETLGMWQQVGFLADAFDVFKQYGLSIDLVSTSDSNVTVSLDPGANTHFNEIRDEFVDDLNELCRVEIIESTSAVSLLGRHIRTILHQLGSAFEVFQEHEVYLVSQAANDLNFTFVVASDQADRLVQQLHEQVISKSSAQVSFGPTWQQINGSHSDGAPYKDTWWKGKRETLIQLAEKEGPAYVYDSDHITETVDNVKGLESLDQLFYAIKANDNEELLKIFYEKGLGFECVSIGEVEYVLDQFPDIDRERILFTPNFAPRSEYEQALQEGVHVTLDNIFALQEWTGLFEGQDIFLRIDPGHGHGHHKHVRTGGVNSKFGIPRFELEEVKSIVDEHNIRVKGLHAHIGSGIKDPESWKRTALVLAEVAQQFEDVEYLDVGGGLGVRENEMQSVLPLGEVEQGLSEFKKAFSQYKLWMEPGRYLVATAGVLLARVTQTKGKGKIRYVGVETGMNSLIRPALYGSHHSIVNLSRIDEPATQISNIVGPICESGDKLGIDRLLPESQEGDVVLIANTGAYGHVMSSTYNMRAPAREIVI